MAGDLFCGRKLLPHGPAACLLMRVVMLSPSHPHGWSLLRSTGRTRVGRAEMGALQAAARATPAELQALRTKILNAATADGSGGVRTTGVRWWLKYTVFGRSQSPFSRLTPHSPLEQKVEMENLLLDFCLWLATCRPSGRPISAQTILKYVGQIRRWHYRMFHTELCGDLDLSHLRDLIRGICRSIAQPVPLKRWGVRTQDLSESMARFLTNSVEDCMWRAALTVAFCGLMRGAEFAVQDGVELDLHVHLTRADVKIVVNPDGSKTLVLRMRPAKGKPGQTKSVPLLMGGGGSLLDPVKAVEAMLAADPVPVELEAETPLFRRSNGRAIRVADVRMVVKVLMKSLGRDPARFGAHSLRIGGATAALAAGMSPATIRAAGRWASDIYQLYTRLTRESVASVSVVIGSTPFHDLERGVEFHDEELMLTSEEMPYQRVEDFVERDMIDDAFDDAEGDEM